MMRHAIRFLLVLLAICVPGAPTEGRPAGPTYGLPSKPAMAAYLNGNMPLTEAGPFPSLLSGTGAFTSTLNLTPDPGLIPFAPINQLWSDGAVKSRWLALPDATTITWAATGEWTFPPGTVMVKHFELPTDENNPSIRTRLETRLLVVKADTTVYGVTYKWRADNSDADIVDDGAFPSGIDENHTITQVGGGSYTKTYHYPSRTECLGCHTSAANFILSASTKQLNSDQLYPATGNTDNQLRTWNHIGLFDTVLIEADIPAYDALSAMGDVGATLEERVKSYLHSNCSHCHRPGGPAIANWDGRYETPMAAQNIINGNVNNTFGIDNAFEVVAQDIWRSILLLRMNTTDPVRRMPSIDRRHVHTEAVSVFAAWINSLPGTAALAPPAIHPDGGDFSSGINVTMLHPDSDVQIRYTTNGTDPSIISTLYTGPFPLALDSTVRARAFRTGDPTSAGTAAIFNFGVLPTPTVLTPTISPNGGGFPASANVTLSTATGGAELRYTTDGTTPTTSSRQYTGAFTIDTPTLLKVRAFAIGMTPSSVAAAMFVFGPGYTGGGAGGGGGGGGGCGATGLEPICLLVALILPARRFSARVSARRRRGV